MLLRYLLAIFFGTFLWDLLCAKMTTGALRLLLLLLLLLFAARFKVQLLAGGCVRYRDQNIHGAGVLS